MYLVIRISKKLDKKTVKTLNLMIEELNEYGTALLSDKQNEELERDGMVSYNVNDNINAILELYDTEHSFYDV